MLSLIIDENLFGAMIDLVVAGSETTTTVIHWSMYYLAANPDIQEKCRQEIYKVVILSLSIDRK